MNNEEMRPDCGRPTMPRRDADDYVDPGGVSCLTAQVAARDAEIARLRADLADADAHWREAEAQAVSEGRGHMLCGHDSASTEGCVFNAPSSWSRRAKGYRCAACEEAGR